MITALIILLLMSLFGCQKTVAQEGPVTHLQYRLSEMRNRTEYIFDCAEDGTCYLTRIVGYRDDEGKKVQVPEATAEDLWQIIQEEKMLKYKELYTPKFDVRDGYMWHLDVRFKEGKLYTGGDNVMPDSGKGIRRLEKYLEDLWESVVPPTVEKLEYHESSSMAEPIWYFKLYKDNESNQYWLINASKCHRMEARRVEVPMDYLKQIWPIVSEEKMYTYQRDYRPEFEVLDGHMWNIYICFFDTRKSVYSSGYEAWPGGNGLERIEQWCCDTWKALEKKAESYPLKEY